MMNFKKGTTLYGFKIDILYVKSKELNIKFDKMMISDTSLWMYNDETTTLSVMDMKSQKITVAVIKKINAMISIHQNDTIYYNA